MPTGPTIIHLELSSVCDKNCWMCGRRKLEREHPELCDWGFMPIEMVYELSKEIQRGSVVQFHGNGESLCYPYLGGALSFFFGCIRQFNTNAKLLLERAEEVIENLEILTISVIPKDPEAESQFEIVRQFLAQKGDKPPQMVYRLLGEIENPERWRALPGLVVTRTLHSPDGSRAYKKPVTIPEIGICLDLLTHLTVDRYGNISLCVRFDPEHKLRLGNINKITLWEAWNGTKRKRYLENHIRGKRDKCPGCDRCEFWGVPIG